MNKITIKLCEFKKGVRVSIDGFRLDGYFRTFQDGIEAAAFSLGQIEADLPVRKKKLKPLIPRKFR